MGIRNKVSLGVLLLFTAIAYFPSLRGDFLIDDERMMSSSFEIHSWNNLWQSMSTGFGFDPPHDVVEQKMGNLHTHRPVPITLLLLYKSWFGQKTIGYHLCNLILHLLNVVLVWVWFQTFLTSNTLLLFSTGLFALHPFHTDAISWINGLSDPLMTLFILLALYFSRLQKDFLVSKFVPFLFIFLSLLTKETAIFFIPFVPVFFVQEKDSHHERRTVTALLAGVVGIWWTLRMLSLGSHVSTSAYAQNFSFLSNIPNFFIQSIFSLFNFFNTHVVMQFKGVQIIPRLVGSVLTLLTFGWMAWTWVKSLRTDEETNLKIFVLLFLSFLIPIAYIHEIAFASPRMFYFPILALSGFIGLGFQRLFKGDLHLSLKISLLLFLMVTGISCWNRSGQYRSAETLWKAEVERNPENSYGYHYYGYHLMKQGRYSEALPIVEQSYRLDPTAKQIQLNLGVCYMNVGKMREAKSIFMNLLHFDPHNCTVRYNLALILKMENQFQTAKKEVGQILTVCPNYESARQLNLELIRLGSVQSPVKR